MGLGNGRPFALEVLECGVEVTESRLLEIRELIATVENRGKGDIEIPMLTKVTGGGGW